MVFQALVRGREVLLYQAGARAAKVLQSHRFPYPFLREKGTCRSFPVVFDKAINRMTQAKEMTDFHGKE